ncbi:MAG: tetratricopeptide repeat protein, partial [Acidobacteriia bacterium]|nr:tetratricopeptide repeat protein [Terriglobia bacterium]
MRVPLSTSWKFGALVCALACASCTREVKTTSATAWPPPPNRTPQSKPVRQVNNATDAGEGDPEARRLRERLAADANDLDARLSLARLYARQGHPDLALEHYRFAAERFPDSVPVTLALAKTLREMGQSGPALEILRQGMSKHPEANWELLSLQGILDDEQGDHGEAETAFRKAAALEPARAAVHNNLGYNLLLQEKFPEA